MKNISIVGVSGTIGKQAIKVIEQHSDQFNLVAVSVGNNIEYAIKLAQKHDIKLIGIKNIADQSYVQSKVNCEVIAGPDATTAVATYHQTDTVIMAIVGSIGLKPTY